MIEKLWLGPGALCFHGGQLPCTIGRSGLRRAKAEGDSATPVGRHRITRMFYRADRIARPAPWAEPIRPDDLWCDESGHPLYNQHVRAPLTASHERLWRGDALYDLILVTDWNAGGQPGKGSAIFIHQWRRPAYPTAGCIALAREDLHRLARRIAPGAGLMIPDLASDPFRARSHTGA